MTDAEKIARLTKAINDAIEQLGVWLTDNTVEVFEEEPEIDDIRAELEEAIRPVLLP